ncbi:MAG: DUF58 domain-containing protein [Tenuifilaceae bacterium]
MEATDLLKKVRKIEIKTRGLSRHIFAGQYHSAFKGKGMAFSEVREYMYGDDIRNIDWNVTARFNHPYVKIFEEERELTVMLLIDVSGSRMFGTTSTIKRNVIAEISAVLAFSAIQNNDKIGAILFSDRIEKFIPPQKGKTHILRIIRELIEYTPQSQTTNISEALRYLTNAIKKRCTAFILSDFLDFENDSDSLRFKDALTIANNKHDVVGIRVYDKRETEIPPVGLVKLRDAENGEYRWVDTSSIAVRKHYSDFWNTSSTNLKTVFSKCKVDWVSISTDEDYVKPLILLFKHRG